MSNIVLRIPGELLAPLLTSFHIGAEGAAHMGGDCPLDLATVERVRDAFMEMRCDTKPGLPLLLHLGSAVELYALEACFVVGVEINGQDITDDQFDTLNAIMGEADTVHADR